MPDLLAYWLTGERGAEATNASTTQLLDARSGEWAYDADRAARASRAHLPAGRRSPDRSSAGSCRTSPPATGLPQGDADRGRRLARHRLRRRRSAARRARDRRSSRAARGRSWASSSTAPVVTPEAREGQPHERARLRRDDPASQERDGSLARAGVPPRVAARGRCAGVPGARASSPATAPSGAALRPGPPRAAGSGRHAGAHPGRLRERRPGRTRRRAGADARDLRQPRLQVPARARADRGGDRQGDRLRARDRRRLAEPLPLPADRRTSRAASCAPGRSRRRRSATSSCSCTRSARSRRSSEMREIVARSADIRTFEPDPAAAPWDELYARFQTVLDAEVRTR